jgi:predicted transcriptional regulator
MTYPYLADGVLLTGGAGAWQLSSNFIEIIPQNAITEPFDIHHINIGETSASDTYQIVLYSGTAGNEVFLATTRVRKESAQSATLSMIMCTPIVSANTRISAKIASSTGGADTLRCSLQYHTY